MLVRYWLHLVAQFVGISYHSLTSILGMLCSHANLPVSKVKIADFKSYQFFTTQSSIVGNEHHDLIPKWFSFQTAQHVLPLLVGREPGEFVVMRKQPSITYAAKSFAWDIMTPRHRVILTKLLFNKRVAKQA